MPNNTDVPQQARRIEELVTKLERCGDPALVATARELVEALMDLHGAALERMLEIVAKGDAAGGAITEGFSRDDLVGSLLLLYDLHPLDLETRVRGAVDKLKVRNDVELVSFDEGVARIRVRAAGSGCGSSASSLKTAVEEAIVAAAPDLAQLIVEGPPETAGLAGFVPLETLIGQQPQTVLAGTKGGA